MELRQTPGAFVSPEVLTAQVRAALALALFFCL
jgi:hypothetical protein